MSFQYESVIFPEDRPVVMVHRGWQSTSKKSSATGIVPNKNVGTIRTESWRVQSSSKPQSEATGELAWGQRSTSEESNKRPRARVNVKSKSKAKKKVHQAKDRSSVSPVSSAKHEGTRLKNELHPVLTHLSHLPSFQGSNSIAMNHYLNYYLYNVPDVLYPLSQKLSFNPIRDRWFRIIVTNEVWFLTIMYCAARELEINSKSVQYSKDATRLMDMVLHRLGKTVSKASEGELPLDQIICAIACLTTIENGLNNHDISKAHARGLAELVRKRGGISMIHEDVRSKIHRAAIETSIDSLTPPLLPLPQSHLQSMSQTAPKGSCYLGHSKYVNVFSHLDPGLAEIAKRISDFGDKIERAIFRCIPIDPEKCDQEVIHVQHALLVSDTTEFDALENAFRIAAMLYVKSLTNPVAVLPRTSGILIAKLRQYLSDALEVDMPLFSWIVFIGLMASLGTGDKAWFRSRLGIRGWAGMKEELEKVLWIGAIHDYMGEKVWLELQIEG